jgi:epoxide hydrolase-like predicted phosphatase
MMKIEALIFDIGNVIVPFDWQKAAAGLRMSAGKENALMPVEVRALVHRFEVGEISREEFVSTAARAIGFQEGEQKFIAIFNGIFSPNLPMERIIQCLSESFPLYLLSNTSDLHLEYLQQSFKVLQLFTDGVYSFRAKCVKPDRRIFQAAVQQFGVTPERTIYIDDLAANVRVALDLGFNAIQYELSEHAEFERQLSALGIPISAGAASTRVSN